MLHVCLPEDMIEDIREGNPHRDLINDAIIPIVDHMRETAPMVAQALTLRMAIAENVMNTVMFSRQHKKLLVSLDGTTENYLRTLPQRTKNEILNEGQCLVDFAATIQKVVEESQGLESIKMILDLTPSVTKYLAHLIGIVLYIQRDMQQENSSGDNDAD